MKNWLFILVAFFTLASCSGVRAQAQDANYPGRMALIVNNCSFIQLSKFFYSNQSDRSGAGFYQNLSWTNTGTKAIVAFEVVILKYDAFDRRMIGTRWVVTGKDSSNWRPLTPNETGRDFLGSRSSEEVFTAIAYISLARLEDGTIWRVNEAELLPQLQKVAPSIKEFGDLNSDTKTNSKTS